jgi:lipopolysaccharide transport system ATP-binding protein
MSIVLKVENISKQYRLGKVGTGTISHDLNRWWHRVRGREDPYLKIGDTNDRTTKGTSEYVWALRDINFEIEQGSIVGIIGRNGAGKSTLLKILSRTTAPTTGDVKIRGRVASLLEVGTGFHPELSGRDNIYLNGAILGMTRKEITCKFDEIVDFAGVERYIDTPVKRYSSGMYVRLAFAVAAHLESEILIVDEVLAVGDAEFQKKCLGKMGEVSRGEGRTVLFVSHNMAAVKELTSKSILLVNGSITFYSNTIDVIQKYNERTVNSTQEVIYNQNNWEVSNAPHLLGEIRITQIEILGGSTLFKEGDSINFCVELEETLGKHFSNLALGLRLMTNLDQPVGTWFSEPKFNIGPKTRKSFTFEVSSLNIAPGMYYFTVWIGQGDYKAYSKDFYGVDKVMHIEIESRASDKTSPVWYKDSWGHVIFKDLIVK